MHKNQGKINERRNQYERNNNFLWSGCIIMVWTFDINTIIGCDIFMVFNKRNCGVFQKNFTV